MTYFRDTNNAASTIERDRKAALKLAAFQSRQKFSPSQTPAIPVRAVPDASQAQGGEFVQTPPRPVGLSRPERAVVHGRAVDGTEP